MAFKFKLLLPLVLSLGLPLMACAQFDNDPLGAPTVVPGDAPIVETGDDSANIPTVAEMDAMADLGMGRTGFRLPIASEISNLTMLLQTQTKPRPVEFRDPKDNLTYSWFTYGMVQSVQKDAFATRFAVFSQSEEERPRTQQAARFLLRLWEQARQKLRLDHPRNSRIVEVFLSWGGIKTGGEQLLMGAATDAGKGSDVRNLIYIYQTGTLEDPVEWARELAHEYGHSVFKTGSGFEQPESWANGLLGEKLFLKWIAQEMKAERLTEKDTMGATLAQLESWVQKNVTPLENAIWTRGLKKELLKGKNKAATDEFLSLALYADAAYGGEILERAINTANGTKALDFYSGLNNAISERASVQVKLPESARTTPVFVYLPGSKWKAPAGVKMTAVSGGWFKVKATGAELSVIFTHQPSE